MTPTPRPAIPMPQRIALVATSETLAPTHAWAMSSGLGQVVGVATPTLVPPHLLASVGAIEALGTIEDLPAAQSRLKLTALVVCLPAPMEEAAASAAAAARALGLRVIRLPAPFDLAPATPGGVSADLDPEALIGRGGRSLDPEATARARRAITDKRVLITGAGGSIGSELAKIVAGFEPESVVLMERSENALFEIDRQLAARFPRVPRAALLHDVVEAEATLALVREHAPSAVFHAAAHKHVPLMEDHPSHALTNNVFGAASIAEASIDAGADVFVLISTDKAVHPSSVMGATKRISERYVQGVAQRDGVGAAFAVVRFGNVLGSAGSVLPIWSAQLNEGEPISVTDERMTRYFMTIPEAAALVTQAGAMTRQGEPARVFVLDMGEPVRIIDLARRFVEAHGMTPLVRRSGPADAHALHAPDGRTGEIVITGARPGEKLEERLAYADERLAPSDHPGIRVLEDDEAITPEGAAAMLAELDRARADGSRDRVLSAIAALIPGIAAERIAA